MKQQPDNKNQPLVVVDAEWMQIHADTFISQRDRILEQQRAFKIDRDYKFTAHLPNSKQLNIDLPGLY